MAELQDVFHRIHATKREQREIRSMYRDALSTNKAYKDLIEGLDTLKAKKKQIEQETKNELGNDWEKLDLLKLHVKQDNELLSDLALNKLMAGETVALKDKDDQDYEPVFTVKFKKANVVDQHPK
jgi:hypothetical protein